MKCLYTQNNHLATATKKTEFLQKMYLWICADLNLYTCTCYPSHNITLPTVYIYL